MKISEVIKKRAVYKVLATVRLAGKFYDEQKKRDVEWEGDRLVVGVCNREDFRKPFKKVEVLKVDSDFLGVDNGSYVACYFDEYQRVTGVDELDEV